MRVALSALLALLVVSSARPAQAMSGFQNVVVSHYGLPSVQIDAPNGCKLCHVNESGGLPVSRFGSLLETLGANGTSSGSIDAALTQLDQQYPDVADELRHGIDPNTGASAATDGGGAQDGAVTALALPADAIPQYGCQLSSGGRAGWGGPGATLGLVLSLASRRRRCRRSS